MHKMFKIKALAIPIAVVLQALPALAGTTQLPSGFAGSSTDYIVLDGNSYPSGNLICFSGGCGGGFQGTVYGTGSTTATGPSTLTSVWCVDYQLDVTTSSRYIANISSLNAISVPADNSVRYGNLNTVDPTGAAQGWTNAVTDPTNLDGGGAAAENSAAYRYTLAAALVSQYVDTTSTTNPTNLDGSSPVNQAIQKAIWYITYNSDYQTGATWAPTGLGGGTPVACSGANNVNTNYMCWVQYAETHANTVNTSAWAVISGPANSSGSLLAPQVVNGYPSFQTFLVQVDGSAYTNGSPGGPSSPTPEPTYFVLTLALGGLVVFARIRSARKQSTAKG
jgi:hypothetical protein